MSNFIGKWDIKVLIASTKKDKYETRTNIYWNIKIPETLNNTFKLLKFNDSKYNISIPYFLQSSTIRISSSLHCISLR